MKNRVSPLALVALAIAGGPFAFGADDPAAATPSRPNPLKIQFPSSQFPTN
jgi:hypothetical protein